MKKRSIRSAAACTFCVLTLAASTGCDQHVKIYIGEDAPDTVSESTVSNSDSSVTSSNGSDTSSAGTESLIKPDGAVAPTLKVGGEYTVTGAENYLPLSTSPSSASDKEILQLHNGDKVVVITNKIYGDNDEYWYVKVNSKENEGKAGYINKYFLKATDSDISSKAASSKAASSKAASSKAASSKAASSKAASSKAASSKAASSKAASSKADSSKAASSSADSSAQESQIQQQIVIYTPIQEDPAPAQEEQPAPVQQDPTPVQEESAPTQQDPAPQENLFDIIPSSYSFLSGAGGWSSSLKINSDGSFTGSHFDSDMGDRGTGYPNGTVYHCDFSGKFGNVKKIDDYTYTMELLSLTQTEKQDTSYIKDGVRYICSYPYGIQDGKIFEVYLPGKPMSEISDDCKWWLLSMRSEDRVPEGSCALCQDVHQFGWFSN